MDYGDQKLIPTPKPTFFLVKGTFFMFIIKRRKRKVKVTGT